MVITPALPSELLGYDRAITIFSPDGRLLQVEYARKTVEQGAITIGIVAKDGVVLIADKRIFEKLVVPESVEKIFQIDEHIGATMSGLISDGRVLVERAQEEAQRHRLIYDEPIRVIDVVKEICNIKQYYTQYAGTRPFGVSLLIGGVDGEPKLFLTEPSGIFYEYKATAVGENAEIAIKVLEDNYNEKLKIEDAIKLGIKAIKTALGNKFKKERIEIAVIPVDTKKFRKFKREEVENFVR